MRILKVFPSKTSFTPSDAIINRIPGLFDVADEIHISVSFTWDIRRAEYLASQWKFVAPVKIGGPAMGDKGGEFIPGMYLKHGITITSRGCNNKCWFCSVWKRDGSIRELKINPGYIVQDDNLFACSKEHKIKVFEMLQKQNNPIRFTGGVEAKVLTDYDFDLLSRIKIHSMFFAYDTPDDLEPLIECSKKLFQIGITPKLHKARCYVLVGYRGDTFDKALKRILSVVEAGYFPFAMLYRDFNGNVDVSWKKFQREWANPIIVGTKVNGIFEKNNFI